MSKIYRDEKQREFLSLRQRTLTVAKYEVRFTQLSQYAPMMVATEKDKCRRFKEGLYYEIRSRITPSDLQSFQGLRAAAIRAERLIREQEKYLAARKSKRSASSQGGELRGRSKKNWRQNNPAQSQTKGSSRPQASGVGESRGQGSTAQPSQTCAHCGRPHAGECRRLTGACYGCREQGHLRRDCPYKKKAGTTDSEPTVQGARGQGQAASAAQTRGRQGTQGPQQQGQARAFAVTGQEAAAATSGVDKGKILSY